MVSLLHALEALRPELPVGVAYSGGADSTALLHAAARLWPGRVAALHVHHGLQQAADAFSAHCAGACARLGVPLLVVHVDARHAPGESPEDAARRARYEALASAAQAEGLACVLLAQHADDQVETVLLALSRGAGLPGLAAMPSAITRAGMRFHRPWLEVPGPELRQWLVHEGISFIEDPTNSDLRYTRNRIRHGLLPALERAFPQHRATFARSARHAAQAQGLLEEIAREDFRAMQEIPSIPALRGLSRARQANVLRQWLRDQHGQSASAAQLDELQDQLAACSTRGHRIHLKVGQGHVDRDDDRLRWLAA